MRRFAPLLLCLVVLVAPTQAQDAASIAALVSAYHDAGRFDGSVLVSDGGAVVYSGGVGMASVEWGIPNAADTRFRVGSVTKQFTAALVLQLAEQGLVDLQAPITTYVPAYPAEPGDRITVHHLLTHTSGIPNYTDAADFGDRARDPFTPDAFLAAFQDLPLDFKPGTAWSYSNSGYFLLGVLVEKVTGQTYAEALRERVLEPAGMTDSAYGDGATVFERAATGYVRSGSGLHHADYIDTSIPYAAGMLLSTVQDLRTWSDALMAGRVFQRPETLALMTAPHVEMPGTGGMHYGYGVVTGAIRVGERAVPVVEHDGGIPGFATGFRRLTDRDAVIAVISNTSDGPWALVDGITALLYGEAVAMPRPSVVGPVRAALASGGVAAAAAAFREARASDAYEVTESDLNTVGYEALRRSDVEVAVALFRLNVETYPDAPNPHDSLGEALLAAGDTVAAEASYRRALALDPSSASARAALAAMRAEPPASVTVPEAVLARYVGRYEIQPGFVLAVTREGLRLFTQATGQGRVEILPASETAFSVVGIDARLVFEAGDPAPAVTLFQGGREVRAPRVE